MRAAILLCAALLCVAPAVALDRDLAAAQAAFDSGAFGRAALLARKVQTGEGDALASRAEMVRGDFISTGEARLAHFEAALRDGRRAVARAPDRPEAHLAVAVALGLVARREGSMAAHFGGMASEARNHIDRALALNPDNAWAHAALGGWHLEIAYEGGPLGSVVYGASAEAGIAAYEQALVLDPANMSIAWQYAFQLAGFGGPDRLARASELIGGIVEREPHTALETLLRDAALELKQALDSRDTAAVSRIVALRLGRAERHDRPPAAPGKR
jgi:tetratricopeptide (TPR) repeat protein